MSTMNTNELEVLRQQIAKLTAERDAALAKKNKPLTFKVSEKGALCVYGLGRFPTTLYRSQWERLIKALPELQAFMEANKDRLVEKGQVVANPVVREESSEEAA